MRLMVIDTVGGNRFTKEYLRFFPNVKVRGIEKEDDGPCDPHGYQVGYLAGCLLNLIPGDHELIFVRNFRGDGSPVPGVNNWLLDVIEDERPDGLNGSWGQEDQDTRAGERWGRLAWESWASRFKQIALEHKIASFFAAGNSDQSSPGNPDLDEDVDFPQRLMPFVANIIGSHKRNGKPSEFSGDGMGVQCCFYADPVRAPDGNGVFHSTRGTSFASPKALATWSYYVKEDHLWRPFVEENCKPVRGWTGALPHPKWGRGSLEHMFQSAYKTLPSELLPPRVRSSSKQKKK